MLVLVIDTSSAAVTAALGEVGNADARIVAEQVAINARGHGELLAPAIAACLDAVSARPADLGAVVAGLGPGPFTGLRVGLVTAAVIGDALGVPTYGACSLDALVPENLDGELFVAADARRHEVYWARYDADRVRIAGPEVARPEDIDLATAQAMAGAGARLYAERFGLPLVGADHPRPSVLLALTAERVRAHAPAEVLTPLYLRRPDAVANPVVKPVSR